MRELDYWFRDVWSRSSRVQQRGQRDGALDIEERERCTERERALGGTAIGGCEQG